MGQAWNRSSHEKGEGMPRVDAHLNRRERGRRNWGRRRKKGEKREKEEEGRKRRIVGKMEGEEK